ncbi:ATP-dependent DNA helicase [Corynebacterium sp.]|uniref:ATP-dependent helicase n=1 Tax=Corynebacterium sp. TaxID=1720 RepID=UPI0026DCEF90|nr:ATP-dependent DNA helicase [Corynebacterium sp.]MDO5032084.1 ATP-dependent DNA helicase [Corynebacterium sp.]
MSYNPQSTARAGVVLPPSPEVRLIPRTHRATARTWDFDLPRQGRWRVLGTAGAGVSSLLVDVVLNTLATGAEAGGILVVAPSKESGSLLRRELAERLADFAAQASMVRSVHSLAFALLRQGVDEELRLITGAEQDAVIRELLEGQAEDGRGSWPEEIRPALTYVGFARQLRDLLLRAIERGLGPGDLEELGRTHHRPMWAAAGEFLREYERTQLLAGSHSLSAAELVSQVLMRPELVHNHPWHTIIVDDAQLLDPMSGRLIEELSRSARLCVVGGDPDQAVFAFRGADSRFLSDFPAEHELRLEAPQRRPAPACVSVVDSRGLLRDVVADTVRRRHLEEGVDWREIAVIVRSTGDIGPLRRALLSAGVPVHINPTDVVLAEQRLVKAVLLALRALQEELSNAELEELITGPVGGADPVTLRRLIRGLRRWRPHSRGIDSLRDVLGGDLPDFEGLLTEREEGIVQRIRGVLEAGRQALRAGGSVEEVLWEVWQATGLDARLQAAALRGGATGSQADRDLDAMMALFDAAGDHAERRPGASLEAFLRHILEQELPTGVRDRRAAVPQAVEILTAHGAVGREWDTVIVAGAQEGTWPSLGETGSLFGQEDLVDLLDRGIAPGTPVSHVASRLAEERRLFHVATTRHRHRLLIVSVDCPDGDRVEEPSRFVSEFLSAGRVDVPGAFARAEAGRRLARQHLPRELGLDLPEAAGVAPVALRAGSGTGEDAELDPLEVSVLSVPSFVAALRRVLTDPETGEAERSQAARQLARLAEAGVPGAHPQQWWAARSVAGNVELHGSGRVSPSRVEALLNCPLNAVLGNLAEEESTPLALLRGTMAHAFLEALGRGADPAQAHELVARAYEGILDSPQWKRDTDMESFHTLLDRTYLWAQQSASALELEGVEVPVTVEVAPGVSIGGYIDRLARAGQDYVVVDLKTGSSAPSRAEAQANPQLMTYQLALAHGQLVRGAGMEPVAVRTGEGLPRGGGVLVYPAKDSASITTREQAAIPPEELAEFAAQLPALVEEMRGPRVSARENPTCQRCAIRSICPVKNEGGQVTDAE